MGEIPLHARSSGDGAYVAERGFVLGKFRLVTEGDGEGLETASRGSTCELVGEVVLGRALEGHGLMRERGDTAGGTTRKGRRSGDRSGCRRGGRRREGRRRQISGARRARPRARTWRGCADGSTRGVGCVLRGPPRTVDGCPSPRRAWTQGRAGRGADRDAEERADEGADDDERVRGGTRPSGVFRAARRQQRLHRWRPCRDLVAIPRAAHEPREPRTKGRGRRWSESVNARGRRARFERVTQTTVRGSMRVAMWDATRGRAVLGSCDPQPDAVVFRDWPSRPRAP